MKLSEIGEISLIQAIRKKFSPSKKDRGILASIGDDSAVINPSCKKWLFTTDMMVEGIHFDTEIITPYQLGFKLVSVNASDIYAMGGVPKYLLLNIAMAKNADAKFFKEFYNGIQHANKKYGISLVGGDLSSSKANMFAAATLIGFADKPVMRSGAKPGDKIYVTGSLGNSACGLAILKKMQDAGRSHQKSGIIKKLGIPSNEVKQLLLKHLMPVARNSARFAKHAIAMIDISDGLFIDLTRLCAESNVGATIYKKLIPISKQMKTASSALGLDAFKLAASGGEDYELLFTAPPDKKINAIYIGDIVKTGKKIIDANGRQSNFHSEGYQHFAA
jgi:thiamine-monophosphate kinase